MGLIKTPKVKAAEVDPSVALYGGKYGGMTDEQIKAKDLADLEAIKNEPPPPRGVKPETRKKWEVDKAARLAAAEGLVKNNPELTAFARTEGKKLNAAGDQAKGQMDQLGSAELELGQDAYLKAQGRGDTLNKQGQDAYDAAQGRGDTLNATAETLQNRTNPQIDKSALAGAAAQQQSAISKLQGIMDQGPGESLAQAQLRMGTNKAIAASGSLARSGRGYGVDAASRRDALMTQADQMSNLNMQQAVIRAQEQDAERGRQIQGSTTIVGAQGTARDQSITGEKLVADTALTGQAQNDGAAAAARGEAGKAFGEGNDARADMSGLAGQTYSEGDKARSDMFDQAGKNFVAGTDAKRGYNQDASQLVTGQTAEKVGLETHNADNRQGASAANADIAGKEKAAKIQGASSLGAGLSTVIPKSDIRAKQHIKDADVASELDKLRSLTSKQAPPTARYADVGAPPTRAYDIRAAQPYSYEYTAKARAEGQDSGTKVGPMAQDLEKTPLRGAVITGKDGMKSIDTGRLSLGLTGAVAEQQTKIDELDAELARLRGLKSKGGRDDVVADFYRAGGH